MSDAVRIVDAATEPVARTVSLDAIKTGDRGRGDLGDIAGLADSIEARGLIHPPTVTTDLVLVSGERRIAAYRHLGRDTIPVTVVDHLDDAAERMQAELEENTCRKDMTASEVHAQGKRIEAMERPKAEERKRDTQAQPGERVGARSGSKDPHLDAEAGRTYTKVSQGVGMSGAQWKRLKHIGDLADGGDEQAASLLAEVDAGKRTISNAYRELRGHKTTEESTDTRTKVPSAERATQIADLASRGYRASQIADRLGIGQPRVRDLAREHNIVLPDAALGRTRAIDPHRVVAETVVALEGSVMSLDLINLDALNGVDREQAQEWATSLNRSLKSLNRLRNRMKEMAHEQV